MNHILLIATVLCCATLQASDGIYDAAPDKRGVGVRLTRDPEKGAAIWLGAPSKMITDNVYHYAYDGKRRVAWVGKFVGDRPNSLYAKINGEIVVPVSIAGPGKFTMEGVVSESGLRDRFRVTFGVESAKEAAKLEELLRKVAIKGDTKPNQSEQDGADQPATAPESKAEGKEKPKLESEVRPQ